MIRTRLQREAEEERFLAPYAQRVADSVGRAIPEEQHEFRTAFQRDRARVIHSPAFRRLEYKTQVFLNGTGDHFRTRLTHTMEVASVSRAVAGALGANEDLAETIALTHDLGHSCFGHAGEEKLNTLMAGHGGFEHNLQSLRVVELLESKFSEFPGLNLSYEVLEGLRKHLPVQHRPAGPARPAESFPRASLEAQIANASDEIAYYSHDLDDGLDSGLLIEAQLEELALWRRCREEVTRRHPNLEPKDLRANIIRTLTDHLIESLVVSSHCLVEAAGVKTADEVRRHGGPLILQDPGVREELRQLRQFLFASLYYHPEVAEANQRGCALLERLFHHYLEHEEELGSAASRRVAAQGLPRTVCDYIAGMTDRYVIQEGRRLGLVGAGEWPGL